MKQEEIAERERRAAIAALQSFGRWLDEQESPFDAPDELRRRIAALDSCTVKGDVVSTSC